MKVDGVQYHELTVEDWLHLGTLRSLYCISNTVHEVGNKSSEQLRLGVFLGRIHLYASAIQNTEHSKLSVTLWC